MAYAGATLSGIASVLKRVYAPEIQNVTFSGRPTLDIIQKVNIADELGESLYHYMSTDYRRSWAIVAGAEGGVFPAPDYVRGVRPFITPKRIRMSIGWSGDAMLASASQKGGMRRVLDRERDSMVGAVQTIKDQLLWAGHYGHFGRINDTDTGTTAVLTMDTYTTGHHKAEYMFYPGQKLDSYDAITAGTIGANSVSVGSVSGNELTLGGGGSHAGDAENDYMFLEDWYAYAPNTLVEFVDNYALRATSSAFFDSQAIQTVMGQSRGTYSFLEANVDHNSGTVRPLTLKLIDKAFRTCSFKGTGQVCTHIWTNAEPLEAYLERMREDRRLTGDRYMTMDGGWEAVKYTRGNRTVPWLENRHIPMQAAYFLNMNALKLYIAIPFEWIPQNERGGIIELQIDSSSARRMDAYIAYGHEWYNLGCTDFESQLVLRDIDISNYV